MDLTLANAMWVTLACIVLASIAWLVHEYRIAPIDWTMRLDEDAETIGWEPVDEVDVWFSETPIWSQMVQDMPEAGRLASEFATAVERYVHGESA